MAVQNQLRELRPDVGKLESIVKELLSNLQTSDREMVS